MVGGERRPNMWPDELAEIVGKAVIYGLIIGGLMAAVILAVLFLFS